LPFRSSNHAVAEQFVPRGLAPAVAIEFGSALPVASNASEDGRPKNCASRSGSKNDLRLKA
jgi:hypothetical protein